MLKISKGAVNAIKHSALCAWRRRSPNFPAGWRYALTVLLRANPSGPTLVLRSRACNPQSVGNMQVGVSISVLGPVEVRTNGIVRKCTGRQRDLLTRLVLQQSERRPKAALIADLYGEQPIPSADSAFRVVLAQMRKIFEPYQHLVLTGTLYGLDTKTDELAIDAWQFVDGCRDGQLELQRGNCKQAAQLLETALELWRGAPFGGVTRIVEADEAAQRLIDLRVTAQEDFADAILQLGGHTEIVDRLKTWVEENPERERLRILHLISLYRSGRSLGRRANDAVPSTTIQPRTKTQLRHHLRWMVNRKDRSPLHGSDCSPYSPTPPHSR